MNPKSYFVYAGAIALVIIMISAVWSYFSRDAEKIKPAQIQLKDDFLTQLGSGALPASLLGNCQDNLLFVRNINSTIDCGQGTPLDLNN